MALEGKAGTPGNARGNAKVVVNTGFRGLNGAGVPRSQKVLRGKYFFGANAGTMKRIKEPWKTVPTKDGVL